MFNISKSLRSRKSVRRTLNRQITMAAMLFALALVGYDSNFIFNHRYLIGIFTEEQKPIVSDNSRHRAYGGFDNNMVGVRESDPRFVGPRLTPEYFRRGVDDPGSVNFKN